MLDILRMLRPKQWIKNAFVLAPLIFSFSFHHEPSLILAGAAVFCFICLSSITYILNDLQDLEADRLHPVKQHRPLAAGKVSKTTAWITMIQLSVIASVLLATLLPTECLIVAEVYLAVQMAYSFKLKSYAIIDVMLIATGFILRVLMGAYAIDVPVSAWIILCTFLLATFMGFGKRYHELSLIGDDTTRLSLARYSKPLLDRFISISCGLAIMAYSLYAVETAEKIGNNYFVYTIIFVIFGVFRYLQHIYVDERGGQPENIVIKDWLFVLNGFAWLGTCIALHVY
ncbi:MAG: decaprenyl-phosphate phosphoribosyltransferase [Rickettsiales bacterium]|nr:decaprenyl-phosphate phosphoribosyltransferase [Rickettsiales bacterium]